MTTIIMHDNNSPLSRTAFKLVWQMSGAATVSALVFYGMSQLIGQDTFSSSKLTPPLMVDVGAPRDEKPPRVRETLPPKPAVVPPQAPPQMAIDPFANALEGIKLDVTVPPVAITKGESGPMAAPEQDATPVVRMEPKYPVDAARDGVEGWVELRFSIDTAGQVQDVQVVNAEPRRIFDKAAVQALKRWKYRPKVVDGKAIAQTGLAVRLDFNLDKQ